MRTRHPRRASRGFTLMEIMVGSVVGMIVIAGIVAAFGALQHSVGSQAGSKRATESGRAAMEYLERLVRLAGYGVDPRIAFDFGTAIPDASSCSGGVPNNKNNCTAAATATVHGYTTDDLAFRYRDPSWTRRGRFASGSYSLTLEGQPFGLVIPAGKRLIVSCYGGQKYAIVKTSGATTVDGTSVGTIADTALHPVGPSPENCLTATGKYTPTVTLLREIRLRVVDGYLIAFYNLDDASLSSPDAAPVAQNVEDFQVAYVMNRTISGGAAPDSGGNSNWIFGDAANDGLPDPSVPAPTYESTNDDLLRFGKHPANIRGVRMSLVLIGNSPDKGSQLKPQSVEDHLINLPNDGKFRIRLQTGVSLPNMQSRTFFNAPVSDDPTEKLLVSGG